MIKKRHWLPIFIPLFFITAFNISFILYKVKGSGGYGRKAVNIIIDYFIGFHTIPLIVIVFVLLIFLLIKKITWHNYTYVQFLVLVIFFIAVNISLFPEFNRKIEGEMENYFTRKKNNSLTEAVEQSTASHSSVIKSYLNLSKYLEGKTLIEPVVSPIENDHFFKVFVTPDRVLYKDYNYRLSDDEFRAFQNYQHKTFSAYKKLETIRTLKIVTASSNSNKVVMFLYDKTFIFVPEDLIRKNQ